MTANQPHQTSCEQWSLWLSFLADLSVDMPISGPVRFDSSDLEQWASDLRAGLDAPIDPPAGSLEDCLSHLQSCCNCQNEINAYLVQNATLSSTETEPEFDFSFDPTFCVDQVSTECSQELITDCFKQFEIEKEPPATERASEAAPLSNPYQGFTSDSAPAPLEPQLQKSVVQKSHSSSWIKWFSAVAIAASVLLLVAVSNWPGSNSPKENPVAGIGSKNQTPVAQEEDFHSQLLTQVSDLHQMNKSNWVDQQLMVVSLEMELRTLREKMVSLDADPESKNKIITNIDRLLDSVRSVRTPALTSSVAQASPAVHITPPKNQ